MPKKLSVLALVRDIAAGNVVAPALRVLHERGHKTLLLAEEGGKAKDFMTMPFTVVKDCSALIEAVRSFRPDVIISGLSSPRALEGDLDEHAILSGISLVHIEDYWGCHTRSPYPADIYVTVDAAAGRLLHRARPGVPVAIAGFAGVVPTTPNPELARKMDALRRRTGAKVLVYPDGGPECEQALPMLVQSMLATRRPVLLVPKPHPKSSALAHPEGGTWGEWCERSLEPLRNAGKVADFAEPTNEVADCADGVAGSYGSIIMRPAIAGKLALTLWTPAVWSLLKEETGLDCTPLMLNKTFPVLRKAQPLDDFLLGPHPTLNLKPYDARIAADAVLLFFA